MELSPRFGKRFKVLGAAANGSNRSRARVIRAQDAPNTVAGHTREASQDSLVRLVRRGSKASDGVNGEPLRPDLNLGQEVLVARYGKGTIRFIGDTSFASGALLGIDLDKPKGKHDGTKEGVRYFTARPQHGIFVRPTKVRPLQSGSDVRGIYPLQQRSLSSRNLIRVNKQPHNGSIEDERIIMSRGQQSQDGEAPILSPKTPTNLRATPRGHHKNASITSMGSQGSLPIGTRATPLRPAFVVGDIILLDRDRKGVVKYVGNVKFATGIWLGIELVDSYGKHDGEINGKRYFQCAPGRGVFVQKKAVKGMVKVGGDAEDTPDGEGDSQSGTDHVEMVNPSVNPKRKARGRAKRKSFDAPTRQEARSPHQTAAVRPKRELTERQSLTPRRRGSSPDGSNNMERAQSPRQNLTSHTSKGPESPNSNDTKALVLKSPIGPARSPQLTRTDDSSRSRTRFSKITAEQGSVGRHSASDQVSDDDSAFDIPAREEFKLTIENLEKHNSLNPPIQQQDRIAQAIQREEFHMRDLFTGGKPVEGEDDMGEITKLVDVSVMPGSEFEGTIIWGLPYTSVMALDQGQDTASKVVTLLGVRFRLGVQRVSSSQIGLYLAREGLCGVRLKYTFQVYDDHGTPWNKCSRVHFFRTGNESESRVGHLDLISSAGLPETTNRVILICDIHGKLVQDQHIEKLLSTVLLKNPCVSYENQMYWMLNSVGLQKLEIGQSRKSPWQEVKGIRMAMSVRRKTREQVGLYLEIDRDAGDVTAKWTWTVYDQNGTQWNRRSLKFRFTEAHQLKRQKFGIRNFISNARLPATTAFCIIQLILHETRKPSDRETQKALLVRLEQALRDRRPSMAPSSNAPSRDRTSRHSSVSGDGQYSTTLSETQSIEHRLRQLLAEQLHTRRRNSRSRSPARSTTSSVSAATRSSTTRVSRLSRDNSHHTRSRTLSPGMSGKGDVVPRAKVLKLHSSRRDDRRGKARRRSLSPSMAGTDEASETSSALRSPPALRPRKKFRTVKNPQIVLKARRDRQDLERRDSSVSRGSTISFTEDTPAELGSRYSVLQRIGRGNYGTVFCAVDAETDTKVAIKHIPLDLHNEIELRRLIREVRFLRQFSDHPNIVQLQRLIKPVKRDFQHMYMVMELLDEDLCYNITQLNDRGKTFENAMCQAISYQVMCALKAMHVHNVVHRDVSTRNVLLGGDPTPEAVVVKLCDFGYARPDSGGLDFDSNYEFDLHYRAPELLLMCAYDKAVDTWAAACVLAEMLLGRPLFDGTNEREQLRLLLETVGPPPKEFSATIKWGWFHEILDNLDYKDSALRRMLEQHEVDSGAIDLLELLLVVDPNERLTVDEALAHPYFEKMREMRPIPQITMTTPELDLSSKMTSNFLTDKMFYEIMWKEIVIDNEDFSCVVAD